MAETETKLPVGKEEKADRPAEWRPFESLQREVDRLFEDFQLSPHRERAEPSDTAGCGEQSVDPRVAPGGWIGVMTRCNASRRRQNRQGDLSL